MHAPGPHSRREQWRHIRAQADAETQRFRSDVAKTLRQCDRAHRASDTVHKDHRQHSSSRRTARPQTAPALRRRPDTPSHRFADLRPSRVHEDHGVFPSFWSQTKRKLPERAMLDGRTRAFAGLCNPAGSLFSYERVLDQPSELAYERGLRDHSALFTLERENMIEINRNARFQQQQQQQQQRQQTSERRSQTAPAALPNLPHQRRCWDFDAPPPKTFAATAPPELGQHGHGGGANDVASLARGGTLVGGTTTVGDGSAVAATMGMARSAAGHMGHRDRKRGEGWGGDGGPHEKSKDGKLTSSHSHTTTNNDNNHHYGVTPRELNTVFARLQLAGGELLIENAGAATADEQCELRPRSSSPQEAPAFVGDTDKLATFRATCIRRTGRVPVSEQGIEAAWVDSSLFAATWLDIDELVALFQVRSVCVRVTCWVDFTAHRCAVSCLSLVLC